MWLYHVTPQDNVDRIRREGVDPSMSRGKRRWSWYVEGERLTWAIAHVCLKHNTTPSKLVVFYVNVPATVRLKTAWQGVYVAHKRCQVFEFRPAAEFLDDVDERDVKI